MQRSCCIAEQSSERVARATQLDRVDRAGLLEVASLGERPLSSSRLACAELRWVRKLQAGGHSWRSSVEPAARQSSSFADPAVRHRAAFDEIVQLVLRLLGEYGAPLRVDHRLLFGVVALELAE